jgi:hypothetical protein
LETLAKKKTLDIDFTTKKVPKDQRQPISQLAAQSSKAALDMESKLPEFKVKLHPKTSKVKPASSIFTEGANLV